MSGDKNQICILGGGFGGLYTALYLSKFSWSRKCNIILIEQTERFVFTPLLYELLSDEFQIAEIAPSYQKILRGKNIKFYQGKIIGVDLKAQQVELTKGDRLSYDYLVIAVGMKGKAAKIPGAAEYAHNFRTLADLESLQAKLAIMETSARVKLQVAVVGAGASGIELSCKLADRLAKRAQVRLIDRSTEILKNFGNNFRAAAYRALERHKIKVDLETTIAAISAESITLSQPNNNRVTLPADLVLWTAGVESKEWITQMECQHSESGQILTRATLQLIDYPEVFALGDAAKIDSSSPSIPTTAQAAYQQANCIANNLQAAIKGKPLKSFRYSHLGDMLTLGVDRAVIASCGLLLEGYLAATIRKLIYIERLPTNRHRWQVLKNSIWRKIKGIFGSSKNKRQLK